MKKNITKNLFQVSNTIAYKQNQIQSLKHEAFQLKDLQYDLFRLNDDIAGIENKYTLFLDQKERSESLLKDKLCISKRNMLDLQADVDSIKNQIDETTIGVASLTRDNFTLQKSCNNKENQILGLIIGLKQLQKSHEVKQYQLEQDQETLKKIKECKKIMEEQWEKLCKKLNQNSETQRQIQKQNKNLQILQNSLTNTLDNLKNENEQLTIQMAARQKLLKQTNEQYQNICIQTKQTSTLQQKLQKECKNMQQSCQQTAQIYEKYQRQNQIKHSKLRHLEQLSKKSSQQLDKTIIKKDNLIKEHNQFATKNKDLNLEIDDCLIKILHLQNVNKALQKNIETYIIYDEEARMLLDRRQKMTELLEDVSGKLIKSSQKISHLMC